jgi:hypothetical protein
MQNHCKKLHSEREIVNSATSAKINGFSCLQDQSQIPPRFQRNFSAARFISEFGNELAMGKFIHEVAA